MSDPSICTPCVIFALARESKFFRKEFRPWQRFRDAPCWAKFCGPSTQTTLVMHSGMGANAAKRAINWILSKPLLNREVYRPKVVIVAGFAGALIEGLQAGDVLLANEVGNKDGNFYPATWPDALLDSKGKTALKQGRIVTSDKMICSSKEKKELGRITNTLAVDMESAYVAYACAEKKVPFGCIRAISDSVDTGISANLANAISGDRVSLTGLTSAIIRSPKTVLELVRLAHNSQIAAWNLGAALCEMLRSTGT